MTLLQRYLPLLASALLIAGAGCSKPGTPPAGQPPLTTFTQASGFQAFVDRFNHASSDQIQVVAMLSPT